MTRKTYTDAEVWADPRSPAIFEAINLSRKYLRLHLLTYGEPGAADRVRVHLELADAEPRERLRRDKLQ